MPHDIALKTNDLIIASGEILDKAPQKNKNKKIKCFIMMYCNP